MRAFLVATLLLAARPSSADVPLHASEGGLRALVEQTCRLMRAQTPSKELLRLLSAQHIRNGKLGWYGEPVDRRFARMIAFGGDDDAAVTQMVIFELRKGRHVAAREHKGIEASVPTECEVTFRPEMQRGGETLPEEMLILVPQPEIE